MFSKGDSSTGKSHLSFKFAHDRVMQKKYATVGIDFFSKDIQVDGNIYRVQIWDTAGEELFKSLAVNFYRECLGAVVCYDITSQKSFDNLPYWIGEVRAQARLNAAILIVGTKGDLSEKRVIPTSKGEEFAKKEGALFAEVTSVIAEHESVNEAISELVKHTVKLLNDQVIKNSEISHTFPEKLSQMENKKAEGLDCCSR